VVHSLLAFHFAYYWFRNHVRASLCCACASFRSFHFLFCLPKSLLLSQTLFSCQYMSIVPVEKQVDTIRRRHSLIDERPLVLCTGGRSATCDSVPYYVSDQLVTLFWLWSLCLCLLYGSLTVLVFSKSSLLASWLGAFTIKFIYHLVRFNHIDLAIACISDWQWNSGRVENWTSLLHLSYSVLAVPVLFKASAMCWCLVCMPGVSQKFSFKMLPVTLWLF